jgi:hypothetical protein
MDASSRIVDPGCFQIARFHTRELCRDTSCDPSKPVCDFHSYCFSIFVVIDLPFLLNKSVNLTADSSKFWLQTFAGNWSPDSFPPLSRKPPVSDQNPKPPTSDQSQPAPTLQPLERYEFSVSAVVGILLNNATIIVLLGLVWRFAKERITAMKLKTAFAQRDLVIGTTLANAISSLVPEKNPAQIREIVSKSILEARAEWENQTLNDIYGPEAAEKLRTKMRNLNITP